MDEALDAGHRRAAGPADVPAVRRRRPTRTLLTRGDGGVARARPSARPCSTRRPRWPGPRRGEDVILVRRETNPDDLEGMIAAAGILTSRGGKTSPRRGRGPRHGQDLRVRRRGARRRRRPRSSPASATVTIARGRRDLHRRVDRRGVPRRACRSCPRPVVAYLEHGLDAGASRTPTRRPAQLVRAVDRLLAPRRRGPPAAGARQRRHRRGRRRARADLGRRGHRPVPHRAHVPRRPPRADRAA